MTSRFIRIEKTLDGKTLPKHVKMSRDMDGNGIELRYWKFEPFLLFLIPFMTIWSGGSLYGCYVSPILAHNPHPLNYLPFFFGIPFLVVSVFVWYGIFLSLFGTRRLLLEHGRGSYSAKLWGIGRTRRFVLRTDTEIMIDGFGKVPKGTIPLSIANNPFIRKIRIKNGFRSEAICAFWDDDAIDFAALLLKREAGIS